MKRIAGIICAIVVIAILGLTPYVSHLMVRDMLPKLNASHLLIREMMPKILADLKTIKENPPFPKWSRQSNGEPLISQYVGWEGGGLKPLESPAHKTIRELMGKYPKAWSDPEQFAQIMAEPALDQLDTSWLEALNDHDHWNLSSRPEVRHELQRAKKVNGIERIAIFAALPIPSFLEFRNWAAIHFIKKHKEGKAIEGLQTFRRVAELMHTTGTLVGEMTAVTLLKTEHKLASFTHTGRWKVIPVHRIETYKKVAWTWASLVRDTWVSDFPREFEPYLSPQIGVCAGVGENALGVTALADFLEPRWPFEDDFSEPLARTREFQTRTQTMCGLSDLSLFMERTPASANPVFGNEVSANLSVSGDKTAFRYVNPARVPYIRRVAAITLMTVAQPDFLRFYQEQAR